jgi:hypothetical protein
VAIANEILVGRYNRFIQKLLGMKGGVTLSQISGEMTTTLNVANGAETRYLEGWTLFGAQVGAAAQVGNRNAFAIFNPTGSNVVAVVTLVMAGDSVAAADTFQLIKVTTPVANIGTNDTANAVGWDKRDRPGTNMNLSDGVARVGTSIAFSTQTAGTSWIFPIEYPLLPGDELQISSTTNNIVVNYAFHWRERFLEEAERS